MEKKTYLTPRTELIYMGMCTHLLDWSAEKVIGGGTNIPEAKPIILVGEYEDDDEIEEVSLPYYNIWED